MFGLDCNGGARRTASELLPVFKTLHIMQCDGAFISAEVVRQRYVVVVNEYRVHEGLDQALLCLFVRPVSITQAAEIKCDMGFLQVETAGDFPVGNGRLQVGFLLRQLVHALLSFLSQYSGLNGPNEV